MTRNNSVFTENETGEFDRMVPSAPQSEDNLQALIAKHPMLVTGGDDDLLLIQRETGVPGAADANARWSLDNLYVTQAGIPVLVEVKRASDTRLRREVIGQLLEYAANGVAYWKPGSLQAAFEATCRQSGTDPDEIFDQFAMGADSADFWARVDANLQLGNVRLVVLADRIPNELRRIIEFLNEQMRAEVVAVELSYYEADDGRRTLVPRVLGQTERSRAVKSGAKLQLAELRERIYTAAAVELKEYQDGEPAIGAYLKMRESSGFEWVIWVRDQGRNIIFEYIARGSNRTPENRMLVEKLGQKTGYRFNTAACKVDRSVPLADVDEGAVIAEFRRFGETIRAALNELRVQSGTRNGERNIQGHPLPR